MHLLSSGHFKKAIPGIIFLVFLLQNNLLAQGIRGTIKNNEGEPLPFASIYIANLKDGASSNINGEYEIHLPHGKHQVLVQYIGYEPVQLEVDIQNDWLKKDFKLSENAFVLKEVQVKSKAEDPAYTIMRKAIAKRKYHLLQYDSYEVRVYMKGTGEIKDVPFFLEREMKKEGVGLNEAYTSESVSEVKFEQPNKLEEKVISVHTSGGTNGSPAPSLFIYQRFYDNYIADEFVSPLAQAAFSYYRFRYMGSTREGGIEVNKIKVTPRSRGEQVFEGYIFIIENQWAIHSVDLQTSYMGFNIGIKRNYAEVAPKTWMPVTHRYRFWGKTLGFDVEYQYLANASNYVVKLNQDLLAQTEIIDEKVEEVPEEVQQALPKEKDELLEALTNEDKMTRKQFRKVMKAYEKEARKEQEEPAVLSNRTYTIDSLASKRDSAYWTEIRPLPLTEKEKKGYQRDDSLARVEQARLTGIDSSGVIKKDKFKVSHIFTGKKYDLSPRTSLRIYPSLAQVYYNTVEGVNANLSLRLRHQYDSLRKSWTFKPAARYGFESQAWYAKGQLAYRQKRGEQLHRFMLEGGSFVEQFNKAEPIYPHINTLSTLLFRKNYLKLYEKQYAEVAYTFKPSAWVSLETNLAWAQRKQLYNLADYSFFYSDQRIFSSNEPENIELANTGFQQHQALLLEANLSYRPIARYRIYNGKRIPLLGRSPEFSLQYRKGVAGALSSDVDFDQIQLGMRHDFNFGVRGNLAFDVKGGTFLNNKAMYFMDYQHFDGNRTFLSSQDLLSSYRLLDYYTYSTNGSYMNAHMQYQFRKFLLTQLPELRFSGMRESVFLNYLKTTASPHYYEIGYSLDRVFHLLRLEVAASFNNQSYKDMGLRIGISSLIRFNDDD
jgi:hypothetical protein